MKKLFFAITLLGVLSLSCKKTVTCECEYEETAAGYSYSHKYDFEIEGNAKTAEDACKDNEFSETDSNGLKRALSCSAK